MAKVVVITGGSAGVGRATAQCFAGQGYAVAVLARGEAGLQDTESELRGLGANCLGLAVDVADADQVEAAAERVEAELGPIAVWVNCAMVTVFSPVAEMTAEEYRRVTEVTYLGAVHGTLAALRRMKPRNRGSIVQVGSALAYRAIPLQSAYCGAKFAIRGFTDSLRAELSHDHSQVQLTMVQLAAFNTPQFSWARSRLPSPPRPVPPVFDPDVAAEAIVWAAAHRRRELWVGFPTVKTILGGVLLPGVTDRLAGKQAWDGQLGDGQRGVSATEDNLFSPVNEARGVRGRFDNEARARSWELAMAIHRKQIAAGVLALLVALGIVAAI